MQTRRLIKKADEKISRSTQKNQEKLDEENKEETKEDADLKLAERLQYQENMKLIENETMKELENNGHFSYYIRHNLGVPEDVVK